MSQARFQKMQREKAKREKAAAKQARRAERAAQEAEAAATSAADGPSAPEDQVLADLAVLHQRFDDDEISFEDFEAAKSELLQNLRVD